MPQSATALVAQPAPPPRASDARRAEAAGLTALLTVVTVLLAVFLIVAVLLLLRRRAIGPARKGEAPKRARSSAWTEAGRRTPPADPDDDDTIDYDPRDLSPDDVGPRNGPGHQN